MATIREEYEALEAQKADMGDRYSLQPDGAEQALDAALSLCLRAVDEVDRLLDCELCAGTGEIYSHRENESSLSDECPACHGHGNAELSRLRAEVQALEESVERLAGAHIEDAEALSRARDAVRACEGVYAERDALRGEAGTLRASEHAAKAAEQAALSSAQRARELLAALANSADDLLMMYKAEDCTYLSIIADPAEEAIDEARAYLQPGWISPTGKGE